MNLDRACSFARRLGTGLVAPGRPASEITWRRKGGRVAWTQAASFSRPCEQGIIHHVGNHGTATTQQLTGIRPGPGMAQEFDPYHKWLSIPPEEQPPNHYRLLGLPIFESDPDVIEHAADRQMAHLRTFQTGSRSSLSQELLNEISTAKLVLLDRKQKAAYDADLRQQQATPQIVGTPPLSKLPVAAASAPDGESLIPSVPALPVTARTHFGASGPVRKRRTAGQIPVLIGGVAFAFVLIAGIIVVLATASRISNRSDENQGTAAQEESPSTSKFVPTATETAGETTSDKESSGPQPPPEPVKRHLVFLFDDEEAAKEYWSWNSRFVFGADGAKAPKGPRSFFRSRHRYSGDVSIDIDFSFGRATYSNTGGAWVTVWNQQLAFYNQWRPINARLHIHREGDEIVFRHNGEEKRIAIDPAHASEESTMIEIRWRSRTSHFRRIEISAGSVTPAS
jgi:hypothetical protein